jgi:Flp pilus assembly protein TadD
MRAVGVIVMALAAAAMPAAAPSAITVLYPAEGALFPPEITAPSLLWRDASACASRWTIEIAFADRTAAIRAESRGERLGTGEIDAVCEKAGAVRPKLAPEEAAAHSWKPDEAAWAAIKQHSVKRPATVTISGFCEGGAEAVSRASVRLRTSEDPVGAPIFYRDVPLISPPVGERGVIMPLPAEAVPLIAWRLRDIGQPKSRVMMQGLPTCVNCHSFSRDGQTLGIDVDGPANDKGLYGLVHVARETAIRNEDVIRWSAFSEEHATKRFGFMSQVSPDGEYVVTSIEDPVTHVRGLDERLFNGFYKDYGFGQVFYPTRGILAWYSRATGKLRPLPGADDAAFVQASAFWSPDGKYLVYSRAAAKAPYTKDQPIAEYANDPNETQIQYDLYRVPFNGGKGGKAEPVRGASANGKSNNFPKVSPDGRWIVYVQCQTGLLMRPDSELYIVPAKGGTARRLKSNTRLMNSWHSFSPNGRWLVFASKGRSMYTQMYLTHIDKDGNDSPAILIDNATAGNRAVNIPEFVNRPAEELAKMEAPATEFYRLSDVAAALSRKGQYGAAVEEWRKALKLEPGDPRANFNLAVCLENNGASAAEAIEHYRKALESDPENAAANNNLGVALAGQGQTSEAVELYRKALAVAPANAKALANLAAALVEQGHIDEAIEMCRRSVEIDPEQADAQNTLGIALARAGRLDEGIAHLEKAAALGPDSAEHQYNLGRVLAARHRFADAIAPLEKAVEITGGRDPLSLDMLAAMYSEVGRRADAARTAERARLARDGTDTGGKTLGGPGRD